ncbi:hypothetical protein [Natronorubrum halophilum]|uniref:hypothetical protein n=1 Tax=Natronorubrum halophilum TaxID=1702106 RepID=UPI0010C1B437|nr:hypothetical protein [Natronorubrum halophilum]
MDSNNLPETRAEATEAFEHELEALIIDAFACGATVADTWEITTPVSDAPNWSVTIEAKRSNDDSTFDPTFLEE